MLDHLSRCPSGASSINPRSVGPGPSLQSGLDAAWSGYFMTVLSDCTSQSGKRSDLIIINYSELRSRDPEQRHLLL